MWVFRFSGESPKVDIRKIPPAVKVPKKAGCNYRLTRRNTARALPPPREQLSSQDTKLSEIQLRSCGVPQQVRTDRTQIQREHHHTMPL